ncbi:MAG: hypothetical protein J6S58_07515 [Lentisphaeria bacterium]|nr:hypothetical protein [Lentisphaeria bacterium]
MRKNSVGSVSESTSFRKLTDSVLSSNRYKELCYATGRSGGICGQESEGQTDFYLSIWEVENGNLRYAKVIIASDADVDGLHIRNLLITYFLQYFEPLVMSGHLYILETPLFRVRNKKVTYYCYSEKERDEKAAKLGSSAEITRFKGLGEISPGEFKQFIGKETIRLEKVTLDNSRGIAEMLKFYMGDNTPERWEHIVENLV